LTIPVAVFVAVTVTPGINAPVASETVPPNVALLVCAIALPERIRQSRTRTAFKSLFMQRPSFEWLRKYFGGL
jgi:hypothetical protein